MAGSNVSPLWGRRKHLGDLALVFKHRHGTWKDLGEFLKREFQDDSESGQMVSTPSRLRPVSCRHSPGGVHYEALQAAIDPTSPFVSRFPGGSDFRPCVMHGAYDTNKNGGLVVEDLCSRARAFLVSRSREDEALLTSANMLGIDMLSGSSQPESDLSGMEVDPPPSEADDFFEDEDVTDEDLLEAEETIMGLPDLADWDLPGLAALEKERDAMEDLSSEASIVDGSEIPSSSQDSLGNRRQARQTVKMRAATLAYLWRFADRPRELKDAFRQLRSNKDLEVLHLCGCGLCFISNSGAKIVGCAEWSHLSLGSKSTNADQAAMHRILKLLPPAGYAAQVALLQGIEAGRGIF